MNKLLPAGRLIFATGMLALGILCIVFKDFIIGRPPQWPEGFRLTAAVGYLSGALVIFAAGCILLNKYTGKAALIIGVLIFLLSVCRHVPSVMTTWPNASKSIALVGGCLVIAAAVSRGAKPNDARHRNMVLAGTAFLAIFLIVCGYSHFKYAAFVDTLIPAYIPFHSFWTYFCGVCLLAGGFGLLFPFTRSLAALLSAVMIGGWFLLLHIPRFIADTGNTSDRLGLCESFSFCGIFLVLAALTARSK